MTYEIDLKIQNCFSKKIKPPLGYIAETNFYTTEIDPKICAETEAKILGRALSKAQRKKVNAKINYYKKVQLVIAAKVKPEINLEVEVDKYFAKYVKGEICHKTLGLKIKELNEMELNGDFKFLDNGEIEEIEEDIKFYDNCFNNNLISRTEYDGIINRFNKRMEVLNG